MTPNREGFQVLYESYAAKPPNHKQRTILILPPTGGVTYLERSYARSLSQQGVAVKVLQKWTGMDQTSLDLNLHQKLHQLAMRAVQEVIDTCPKNHKISLMGTSVGGIFTAVAASKFDRLDRVLSIAGGSPIPDLIVDSDYETMKTLREKRFKKFNFRSREQYLKALDQSFFLNPHKMPKKFKNKHLGQIILLKDNAVPTTYQKKLQQLWKPEYVREIRASHFNGIIKAWWFFSDEIEKFLIGN